MNDREALQQIANIANGQLGQTPGPSPVGEVPPITVKPSPSAILPGDNSVKEQGIVPGQVIGYDFDVYPTDTVRQINIFGAPNFFAYISWAVFDSGGGRVLHGDNVNVNSGGFSLYTSDLAALIQGRYTVAFAVNVAGNSAAQYRRQP